MDTKTKKTKNAPDLTQWLKGRQIKIYCPSEEYFPRQGEAK